ncbi:hypothetical protein JTB14_008079 [Gonioctena quinquepunctata]|nr:hypothetical protein JTB14_008079 [Gonioctena quinquepunctata]
MAEGSCSVASNSVNINKQLSGVQITESAEENEAQKVMEPIFLDDFRHGEKPRTLKNVLSYLEETTPNASEIEILVGLIYILMLETGFEPLDTSRQSGGDFNFNISTALKHSTQLPSNWKSEGFYKLSFTLPCFEIHECIIACSSLEEDLLVNCVVKEVENAHFTTLLDSLTYFSSSTNDLRNLHFQNIHDFSTKVKQDICYPAKQCILRFYDVKVGCLEVLPSELIIVLMEYMEITDFVHFGMTNKYFNEFLKRPKTWIKRLEKDFNMRKNSVKPDQSYKKLVNF